MKRWRGRDLRAKEQVANAWDSFVNLTPASASPAAQVEAKWLPLKAGQTIPLIGENRNEPQPQEDDPDEFWSR